MAGEYSDPDEGVEIVDIEDVKRMDWMAPETLRRVKDKPKKKSAKTADDKGKGKVKGVCPYGLYSFVCICIMLSQRNLRRRN